MPCGIYKFENVINHMVYIGQAMNLDARYAKHIKNINDQSHQEDLYIALRVYGINSFTYEILESFEIFDQNLLNELECYYINFYNSLKPNGYNMVPGGNNGAGIAKGKAVEQYSLNGDFIAEYPSAHQADLATGINYSSICACCRNEITHTKNYQWKYKNDNKIISPLINVKIFNRPILQFDLTGNIVAEYVTMKEASEKTAISKPLISKVCNNKGNTAGGFFWAFKDNTDIINNFLLEIKQEKNKYNTRYIKEKKL